MGDEYTIAIVGATGLVGEGMIKILEERDVPVEELVPLASEDSAGKSVLFRKRSIPVQKLTNSSFQGVDFALFSAGAAISLEYAPIALKSGVIVIDNSSAFRMKKDVPLVVPEVNPNALFGVAAFRPRGKLAQPEGCYSSRVGYIISNPNCSTIQLVCVLKPIHDAARLRRVVVSTYQSVSGAGREAMEELNQQLAVSSERLGPHPNPPLIKGREGRGCEPRTTNDERRVFPHPIAFNCIPHIDEFLPDGYTKEEAKVINETKKILGDVSIAVTCTAVRVPVWVGHSEAVNIETERKLSASDVRNILSAAPGVSVVDNPSTSSYPLAINAAGKDEVFVGRIREDPSIKNGIDLWIVADNLRKGAALNAVQILECVLTSNFKFQISK